MKPKNLLLAATLVTASVANANFLNDFYNSSGASSNYNAPRVYQSQSGTFISGGSLHARTPSRTLNMVSFTPPSFNAGCGGIDLYLGAFGFPSGAEMTAFLRNVGQAAGGIAFSIALQTLSPELDGQIRDWSAKITEMVKQYRNSCAAAQALLDATGGTRFIQNTVQGFKNNVLGSGSDQTTAETQLDDPVRVNTGAATYARNNPNSGINNERNVVWEALSKGQYGTTMSTVEKQFLMALVGTVVSKRTNSNTYPEPKVYRHAQADATNIEELIDRISGKNDSAGSVTATAITVPIISCSHDSQVAAREGNPIFYGNNNCMSAINTSATTTLGSSYRYRLTAAANIVRNAIRNREPLTATHFQAYKELRSVPMVPLLDFTIKSAAPNSIVDQEFLNNLITLTAQKMAADYIYMAADEAQRALMDLQTDATLNVTEVYASQFADRITEIKNAVIKKNGELSSHMERLNAQQELYLNMQRFTQNSAPSLMASSSFMQE